MKILQKSIVLLVIISISIFFGTSCGAGDAPAEGQTGSQVGAVGGDLYIGIPRMLSGDLAEISADVVIGVENAAARINSEGGVANYGTIELVVKEDPMNPAGAEGVASDFIPDSSGRASNKPHAIVGHLTTAHTKAAMDVYKRENILVFTPTVSSTTIMEERGNVIRLLPSNQEQGEFAAKTASDTLSATNVLVISDDSDYGNEVARFFASSPASNVVDTIRVNSVNFKNPEVSKAVQDSSADLVFYSGYYQDGVKIIKQLSMDEIDVPVLMTDDAMQDAFRKQLGESTENVLIIGMKDMRDTEIYKSAVNSYSVEMVSANDPSKYYFYAYSAIMVFDAAVEAAGSTSVSGMKRSLASIEIETPVGVLSYDSNGNVSGEIFSVYKIVDGKYVSQ